jgi:hypothetical protein
VMSRAVQPAPAPAQLTRNANIWVLPKTHSVEISRS